MTEDQLQSQCVQLARNYYDCLIFSIPNGAYTGAKEASKLKATGLLAGIPDLQLIYAPINKHTEQAISNSNTLNSEESNGVAVFIELKTATGKLSPQQVLIHSKLAQYNIPVYTIRSLEEFKELLERLQVPIKLILN
jgi:VRR-NUC domain